MNIPLKAIWDELTANPSEDDVGNIANWRLDEKTNELVIFVWAPPEDGQRFSTGWVEGPRIPASGTENGYPVYDASVVRWAFRVVDFMASEEFARAYFLPLNNRQPLPSEVQGKIEERVRAIEDEDTLTLEESATVYDEATQSIDMENADTSILSEEQIQEAVDHAVESVRGQSEDGGGGGKP